MSKRPVFTHPGSGKAYYCCKSNGGRGRVFYFLLTADLVTNWDLVEEKIPAGYYIQTPKRGKPMIKANR